MLSKRAHTLSVVDPATLRVVGTAPVGEDPHEVIASADGRTAFVSNYGFGSLHTLAVIDLTNVSTPCPTIDLGALTGPHGLAFEQGKVWFTAEGAKVVGRVDPATARIDLVIGTGQDRTHMIHVSPDGQHVIATNVSSATVSFLDQVDRRSPRRSTTKLRLQWNSGTAHQRRPALLIGIGSRPLFPSARGSEGFDLSPSGQELWVGNAQEGTVSVIDTATHRVTATLPVQADGVNRVKFTLDGRYVLLAGRGPTPLTIVDAHSHAVTLSASPSEPALPAW